MSGESQHFYVYIVYLDVIYKMLVGMLLLNHCSFYWDVYKVFDIKVKYIPLKQQYPWTLNVFS